MVVPFMNLLKSTLSPIPCKCPVSEYCQIFIGHKTKRIK
nr:MAG TPA: hypothetical protein [Caudoviricetes sp.]